LIFHEEEIEGVSNFQEVPDYQKKECAYGRGVSVEQPFFSHRWSAVFWGSQFIKKEGVISAMWEGGKPVGV